VGVAKFINSVKESLGLDEFKKKGKKKSITSLLKKLNARKEKIEKALDKKAEKKVVKELKEELVIISIQIKKGNKILDKFNAK
jgi:prephenate dehydrogenase